jgi:hypothetical protein
MGRADPAGRKHIVVSAAERVQRFDDRAFDVGNDTDFLEFDADIGEELGHVTDILVLGAPGKYVLSDRSGRGWVDAVYDSLVVRAVEPSDSTDTRTVTDWFLGRRIRTSHVPGRDPPRSGEIAYDRQEWNSFFAFVWFSLRSGIQAMVLE